jgi:hypothetical protein
MDHQPLFASLCVREQIPKRVQCAPQHCFQASEIRDDAIRNSMVEMGGNQPE